MERTPSPVHIPVVPTGDDNTRLAVDEAGVVIGDRIGPSSLPRMAPLQAPRRYRCIRRIATAQGALVLATPIRRPVLDAAVAMGDTVRRSSASASRTLAPVPVHQGPGHVPGSTAILRRSDSPTRRWRE
jgi:hypothetical protein